MAFEGAGGCELAQLMTDHVLSDIDRHMLASIMDCNGMTYEVRENRGTSGPGLDNLFIVSFVESRDLLHEAFFNERALLNGS